MVKFFKCECLWCVLFGVFVSLAINSFHIFSLVVVVENDRMEWMKEMFSADLSKTTTNIPPTNQPTILKISIHIIHLCKEISWSFFYFCFYILCVCVNYTFVFFAFLWGCNPIYRKYHWNIQILDPLTFLRVSQFVFTSFWTGLYETNRYFLMLNTPPPKKRFMLVIFPKKC